jgi:hypothetical protein
MAGWFNLKVHRGLVHEPFGLDSEAARPWCFVFFYIFFYHSVIAKTGFALEAVFGGMGFQNGICS